MKNVLLLTEAGRCDTGELRGNGATIYHGRPLVSIVGTMLR